MSLESAKAFIEKIKTDEVFAQKSNEPKDKEERIALRHAADLVFSTKESGLAEDAKNESGNNVET